MPRIAEVRPPAVPTTEVQRERCDRMLSAAARLGAEHGLEHVQMAEVAERAGVAIGTLYRYYPSKHHLFAAVLARNVAGLGPGSTRRPADPAAAVADLMARACRSMLRHPQLARAMITSVNSVRPDVPGQQPVMREVILRAAGVIDPTDADLRLARLVEQLTYGVLTWAVGGELSAREAEADVRRGCLLLCAAWSAVG